MSLLDFLTQPREQYHAAQSTALDLPHGQSQQAMMPPTQTEQPSLLKEALHYLMQPGTMAAIGAGVKGLGGDDSGVGQAIQIGQNARTEKFQAEQIAEKKQALAKKNAALRAAYKTDARGKARFDPAAYVSALGDDSEADLGEIANLHNAVAPKVGVSGDTPYTQDDEGNTTWGPERPWSHRDQESADRNDEIAQYRELMLGLARQRAATSERQGDERIGISRSREARVGAGGKGNGPRPTGRVF